MRKLLLSSLVLAMVAAPMALTAQGGAPPQSGTIAVTATVQPWGSVTGIRDLVFGNLTRGSNATVDETDQTKNGQVQIQYNFAAKVAATLTTGLTANGVVLPLAMTCSQNTVNTSAFTTVAGCTFANRALPGSLALGNYYLGFGGTIASSDIDVAPAGSYAGVITVTISQ